MTNPAKALGDDGPVVVVGAGQVGSLLARLLARQGHQVTLIESRPDPRTAEVDAGRSINLALATRGSMALDAAGLWPAVEPILVPMAGRLVHDPAGGTELQPYGVDAGDVIHSVSRRNLNAILLDGAEETGGVHTHFNLRCRSVDFDTKVATFTDSTDGDRVVEVGFGTLFGCDGANSVVRDAIQVRNGGTTTIEPLAHGYKELTIPPGPAGRFRLEPGALHIWPRGDFMIIALPNPEGDFTVTLFLAHQGSEDSFEALNGPEPVLGFFERHFPDFGALVPDLVTDFFDGPTGDLSTIRVDGWSLGADAVLVGDAAHAIVPFHGQGMNLGLESARLLDRMLREHPDDVALAFARFEADRKADADAIADMAIDNYVEMRSDVIDPAYVVRRELALELERRYPDKVAARYGMVMFTTMRYAEVVKRARKQRDLLHALTDGLRDVTEVDFDLADRLVAALAPLPAQV